VGAVEFSSRLIDSLAWPAVVLIAVLVFRNRIGDWASKFLEKPSGEFKVGPVAATWTPDAAVALGDAGQQLVEPNGSAELVDRAHAMDELRVEVSTSAEGRVDTGDRIGGSRMESDNRQANVEALIQAAARWGWDQCNAKLFGGFPTPIVEWENDRPYILAGKVMSPGDIVTVRRPEGGWNTRTVGEPDRTLLAPPQHDE
jgi:hypothetical protein